MTDVNRLLEEFIAEDRTGGVADPSAYLARVSGVDRAELAALIDGYLARAPRRAFDRAAFEASPARAGRGRFVGGLVGHLAGSAAAAARPRSLAAGGAGVRLAAELGVAGREAKVAGYYHAMEQGTLPAAGVSDRVLEALGRIVGESAAVLRAAGAALTLRRRLRRAAARRSRGSPRRPRSSWPRRRPRGARWSRVRSATRSTSCSRDATVKQLGREVVGRGARALG